MKKILFACLLVFQVLFASAQTKRFFITHFGTAAAFDPKPLVQSDLHNHLQAIELPSSKVRIKEFTKIIKLIHNELIISTHMIFSLFERGFCFAEIQNIAIEISA